MYKWNKPSKKFTIEELKQKYKATQHRTHTNEVWLCFLRDACISFTIALILFFAVGIEKTFHGDYHVFFKIMILCPFTITLCQFFFPQRLVFFENTILIKRPFKKSAFINYQDIEFASILEEHTRSKNFRDVLVVVTKRCNLKWSMNLANTKSFSAAVKRNDAIIYNVNKRVLIDFILQYRKNFYGARFIDYRYKISFSPFQSILNGEDISIAQSEIAENSKKQKSKESLIAESKNASVRRRKEIADELKYNEILERDRADENGKFTDYSDEEKEFIAEFKRNERKKLGLTLVVGGIIVFLMIILPFILN